MVDVVLREPVRPLISLRAHVGGEVRYTGSLFDCAQGSEFDYDGSIVFSGKECTVNCATNGIVSNLSAKYFNYSDSKDLGMQIVHSYDLIEACASLEPTTTRSSSVIKDFEGDVELSWQKAFLPGNLHQGVSLLSMQSEELAVEMNFSFQYCTSSGVELHW